MYIYIKKRFFFISRKLDLKKCLSVIFEQYFIHTNVRKCSITRQFLRQNYRS